MHLVRLSLVLLFVILFPLHGASQDSLTVKTPTSESGIKLTAIVDKNKVPLNRNLTLTIRLKWYGNLDRYDIHQFDNPIVENLEIVGTGSSNKVANIDGRATAVQEYEFVLKPKSLGMAYIEGVIIKYTDMETNADFRLVTNRIPVEVIDPVPESGQHSSLFWIIIAAMLLLAAGGSYYFLVIRKKQKAEQAVEVEIPLEEKYLQELRENVDLSDLALDVDSAFSTIYKLLRRFLNEKFALPGLEASTGEVIDALQNLRVEERVINEISDVLRTADVIKFSGGGGNRTDLERAFTIFEATLQKSLRGELDIKNETESL